MFKAVGKLVAKVEETVTGTAKVNKAASREVAGSHTTLYRAPSATKAEAKLANVGATDAIQGGKKMSMSKKAMLGGGALAGGATAEHLMPGTMHDIIDWTVTGAKSVASDVKNAACDDAAPDNILCHPQQTLDHWTNIAAMAAVGIGVFMVIK